MTPMKLTRQRYRGFNAYDKGRRCPPNRCWRIAPGKIADLVMLKDKAPAPLLPGNIVNHLVGGASGYEVSHVIVDGNLLYFDGEFSLIDQEALKLKTMKSI